MTSGPSRAILHCVGSAGDVLPMLALGTGLRERGMQITALAPYPFRDRAEESGFRFIPLGSEADYERIVNDPRLWNPDHALGFMLDVITESFRETRMLLEDEIDRVSGESPVLIGSSLALVSRTVRDIRRVPLVTVHLAPSCIFTAHDTALFGPRMGWLQKLPRWLKRLLFRLAGRGIDRRGRALRREIVSAGAAAPKGLLTQWWHSPDLVLAMWPDWFQPPQPDWAPTIHQVGFTRYKPSRDNLDEGLSEWFGSGEKPVVFLAGSANAQARRFFASAIDACRIAGRRGVLLTRFREQLPERLPSGIFHAHWAPMTTLLGHASLIVHHGGIGTSAEAFSAGIPQIVTPMAYDQFDNAARIERLGVGESIRQPTAETLAHAINRLLASSKTKTACARLADLSSRPPDWDAVYRSIQKLGLQG